MTPLRDEADQSVTGISQIEAICGDSFGLKHGSLKASVRSIHQKAQKEKTSILHPKKAI